MNGFGEWTSAPVNAYSKRGQAALDSFHEPGMKGREQAQRDPFSTLSSAASSGVPELYRSPYQSRAPAHQASFPSSNGSFGDFLSAQPREMSGNLGLGVGAADEDEFGGFETAPGGSLGGFGGSPGLGGSYGTSYAASYGSPNGYGSGAGSLVGRPQSGNGPIPLDVFGVDEESMAEAAFLDMDSTALEDALHVGAKKKSGPNQFKKDDLVWYRQRDGTLVAAQVVALDLTVRPPSYGVKLGGDTYRETESPRLFPRNAADSLPPAALTDGNPGAASRFAPAPAEKYQGRGIPLTSSPPVSPPASPSGGLGLGAASSFRAPQPPPAGSPRRRTSETNGVPARVASPAPAQSPEAAWGGRSDPVLETVESGGFGSFTSASPRPGGISGPIPGSARMRMNGVMEANPPWGSWGAVPERGTHPLVPAQDFLGVAMGPATAVDEFGAFESGPGPVPDLAVPRVSSLSPDLMNGGAWDLGSHSTPPQPSALPLKVEEDEFGSFSGTAPKVDAFGGFGTGQLPGRGLAPLSAPLEAPQWGSEWGAASPSRVGPAGGGSAVSRQPSDLGGVGGPVGPRSTSMPVTSLVADRSAPLPLDLFGDEGGETEDAELPDMALPPPAVATPATPPAPAADWAPGPPSPWSHSQSLDATWRVAPAPGSAERTTSGGTPSGGASPESATQPAQAAGPASSAAGGSTVSDPAATADLSDWLHMTPAVAGPPVVSLPAQAGGRERLSAAPQPRPAEGLVTLGDRDPLGGDILGEISRSEPVLPAPPAPPAPPVLPPPPAAPVPAWRSNLVPAASFGSGAFSFDSSDDEFGDFADAGAAAGNKENLPARLSAMGLPPVLLAAPAARESPRSPPSLLGVGAPAASPRGRTRTTSPPSKQSRSAHPQSPLSVLGQGPAPMPSSSAAATSLPADPSSDPFMDPFAGSAFAEALSTVPTASAAAATPSPGPAGFAAAAAAGGLPAAGSALGVSAFAGRSLRTAEPSSAGVASEIGAESCSPRPYGFGAAVLPADRSGPLPMSLFGEEEADSESSEEPPLELASSWPPAAAPLPAPLASPTRLAPLPLDLFGEDEDHPPLTNQPIDGLPLSRPLSFTPPLRSPRPLGSLPLDFTRASGSSAFPPLAVPAPAGTLSVGAQPPARAAGNEGAVPMPAVSAAAEATAAPVGGSGTGLPSVVAAEQGWPGALAVGGAAAESEDDDDGFYADFESALPVSTAASAAAVVDPGVAYLSAWTTLMEVCAKELEAGEAIWQAASAAGRSEQMTSSPQGVAFLAGLANVHLVAAALRATVKRRHASLPDDSTFVEASRRCEAALSARDLDTGSQDLRQAMATALEKVSGRRMAAGLGALSRSARRSKGGESAPCQWAEGFCSLTLLPVGVVEGVPTVAWGLPKGRSCLAPVANLWCNRVSVHPPELP